jgi:hypothetical protein
MYSDEEESEGFNSDLSRKQRLSRYYGRKMEHAYQRLDPKQTNWERSGASMRGWIARFGSELDIPYRSILLFSGSWMILEIGWPLLVIFGIASAGSVWNIPTSIPFMFIVTYALVLVSGTNLIRSLVTQIAGRRDDIVKALFRGYFWSLLSVGLIFFVHGYFHSSLPLLFVIPIFYLLPIDVSVIGTVPVPIPLGFTGLYMDMAATVIMYTVGVTGSSIGGLEFLRQFVHNSSQHGSYRAVLSVLLLAAFPAMNIYFSSVFLTAILDLFGRFAGLGA